MTIREDLKAKTIEAMKARNEDRLLILRSIGAALKDADIAAREKTPAGIDEAAILSMLAGMVKKRNDSIGMYKNGGREDLAAKEQAQIAVIQEFMPKQMTEAEVEAAIKDAAAKTGAASVKEMGKVMNALKESYAGRMDFGKASGKIKELLG